MNRRTFLCTSGLLVIAAAAGQDMPLSQVVIDGEGWKPCDPLPPAAPPPEAAGAAFAVTTARGRVYYTVTGEQAVYGLWDGEKKLLDKGIGAPTGLLLWPDDGTLVVADAADRCLWTFRVEADGKLTAKDRYYGPLRTPPGTKASGAGALAQDADRRVYAATAVGVQVFDPTGRPCGVLVPPTRDPVTAVAFRAGEPRTLVIACGGKWYGRKVKPQGVVR
jgi:hypothetical protein